MKFESFIFQKKILEDGMGPIGPPPLGYTHATPSIKFFDARKPNLNLQILVGELLELSMLN